MLMKSCCFFSCILYSPSQSIPRGQPQRGFSSFRDFMHPLALTTASVYLLHLCFCFISHFKFTCNHLVAFSPHMLLSSLTHLFKLLYYCHPQSLPSHFHRAQALLFLLYNVFHFIHLLFNCRCLCYSASRYMSLSLTPKQFQELLEPFYILVWYIYIFSFSKCFYKAKLLEIRDLILHLIFKHKPKVKRNSWSHMNYKLSKY